MVDYLTEIVKVTLFVSLIFVFFFVIEKKYPKSFTIQMVLIGIASITMFGYLLQSDSCPVRDATSLCIGTPNIFQHSAYYDFFFLRNGTLAVAGHFSVNMMIVGIFFISLFLTKNAYFSAFNMIYMVGMHEFVWTSFNWITYPEFIDALFLFEVCPMFLLAIYKYKGILWNRIIALGIFAFGIYNVIWLVFYDWVITGFTTATISPWYYTFEANALEVGSWLLIFILVIINTYVMRGKVGNSFK